MSNVQVILREKIDGLGCEADVVAVRRGFASNFLIPTGKAFEATKANLRHLKHLQELRGKREAEELAAAEVTATKLRKLKLTLYLSIGGTNKAFGSITNSDIVQGIKEKTKLDIDRHDIKLDKPIKGTGEFEIPVRIHPQVEVILPLKVKAEDERPEKAGESSED